MNGTSYKTLYTLSELRWDKLRAFLQRAADLAEDADKNPQMGVNYDKSTILQILFQMDSMKD